MAEEAKNVLISNSASESIDEEFELPDVTLMLELEADREIVDWMLTELEINLDLLHSKGFVTHPSDIRNGKVFELSGLLSISRNQNLDVKECVKDKKSGRGVVVEVVCPLIIRDMFIEFETSLVYCGIKLCDHAFLKVGAAKIDLELTIDNGNIAVDFVYVISMDDISVEHDGGNLHHFQRSALEEQLLYLKKKYEGMIRSSISLFVYKTVKQILRSKEMQEYMRFRLLENY